MDASYFDPPYDQVASRIFDFRNRFGKAPGEAHIDDIFDALLNDTKSDKREIVTQILSGLLEQKDGLNDEYVLSRVADFIKKQTLSQALLEASERLLQGGDDPDSITETENILYDALKGRTAGLDNGVMLNDPANIDHVIKLAERSYPTGIPELDNNGVGLRPKTMLLYVGAKGTGKSWWMTHLGKQAMRARANVVHISLELDVYEVVARYYQSIFGIGQKEAYFYATQIKVDEFGRFVGVDFDSIKPNNAFSNESIGGFLRKKLSLWGDRLGNLCIQQFATDGLTMGKLHSFLDNLELTRKYNPHVVLIDYPDLMEVSKRMELRHSLNMIYKGLRGIAIDRNVAIGVPTQTGRRGLEVRMVSSTHVSEDISKIQTADQVVTYSQTPEEKLMNLARLTVAHNRVGKDGFSVLISQQYQTGQYVMSSARMTSDYFDRVAAASAPQGEPGVAEYDEADQDDDN